MKCWSRGRLQEHEESMVLMARLQCVVQVAAGGMPMAETHHASHPPGMQSRGGGGGRKLGGRGRGSRPGVGNCSRHQNMHSCMGTSSKTSIIVRLFPFDYRAFHMTSQDGT